MEEQKKKQIVELLVINGQATRLELEGIDPGFEAVLVELNNEHPEGVDPVKGHKRDGQIYYTYNPVWAGPEEVNDGSRLPVATSAPGIEIAEETEEEVETKPGPSGPSSSSPREGSPGGDIPGSTTEDDAPPPPTPPAIDPPADAPGGPGRPIDDAKPKALGEEDRGILAYRVLVKNFRLSTSGGRTKITAIPYDKAQAQIALEFTLDAPTKGDDPVFIDVWRPEDGDFQKILGTTARKTDDLAPSRSTEVPAPEAQETTTEPAGDANAPEEAVHIQEEAPGDFSGSEAPGTAPADQEEEKQKSAAQIREEIQGQGLPPDIAAASAGMMREEPI